MTSPDPKYKLLIDKYFPCPVCAKFEGHQKRALSMRGWGKTKVFRTRWADIYKFVRYSLLRRCPLCTLDRPDLWVAVREWLQVQGYDWLDYHHDAEMVVVRFSDTSTDGKRNIGGCGETDINAILDVAAQVKK